MDADPKNPYAPPAERFSKAAGAGPSFKFKFKFLNDKGQEAGFLSKKGQLREDALVLDEQAIPLALVAQTLAPLNRLVVVASLDPGGQNLVWRIALGAGRKGEKLARKLKREIDQRVSLVRLTARREALEKVGRGAEFRTETCRHCGASIDLTGFAPAPQMYCSYCASVVSADPDAPGATDEADFRLCDKCGYYSRPAVFNSVVIVYVIAMVSWWSRRQAMCHTCMRKEAFITFLKNVPTLVGSPFAFARMIGAYAGGSSRSATFRELDAANKLARAGRIEAAETLYQTVLLRARHAAGVHYDRALGYSQVNDWNRCLDAINAAWADCANYSPALALGLQALQRLGRTSEAEGLRARWSGAGAGR
jgi:hypothetical protein